MRFTAGRIAEATGGRLVSGDAGAPVSAVSTDTRTLGPGQVFFALRGPRFDGHDFVADAARLGAACVVIEDRSARRPAGVPAGTAVVTVPDTVKALGDLARGVRAASDVPWVAITGSAGKTTTKELVAAALSHRGLVLRSEMSFNNRIGVPLTVLKLADEHCAAVVEVGTSAPGEVAELAGIVRPTAAVVTCVGPSHLEGLGTVEAVLREKAELVRALEPGGLAVLPADGPYAGALRREVGTRRYPADASRGPVSTRAVADADSRRVPASRGRVVTFGLTDAADLRGEDVRVAPDGTTEFAVDGARAALRLVGRASVLDALAALAVAEELGVPREAALSLMALVAPLSMRARVVRTGYLTVFEDCYNANPVSFDAAVESWLAVSPGSRHWAVVGDMLELGDESPRHHRELGERLARSGCALVMAVGDEAREVVRGASGAGRNVTAMALKSRERAAKAAARLALAGDVVLVKGSRAVGLEAVAEALESRRPPGDHA